MLYITLYLMTYLCLGIVHAENDSVCSIPINQTNVNKNVAVLMVLL